MKKRSLAIFAAALAVAGATQYAFAVTLHNAYKVPLTQPYERCGEELSTSNCTTNLNFTSPWIFSEGALEIDDDSVGVRLDNIQLRSGESCPSAGGCRCWNSGVSADDCTTSANCSYPNDHCGPNGDDNSNNNWATLAIYFQNRAEGHLFQAPYTDHIRRESPCYVQLDFDIVNTSSNKNRQINQTINTSFSCAYLSVVQSEIRHVEVLDADGNAMAVSSY